MMTKERERDTMSNYTRVKGSDEDKVILLRDVIVPEKFFNKIKTTSAVLDQIFGGDEYPGILKGSCMLFTGVPGAGKSTMCLQLADLLTKQGHSVLYNIGEENEKMVKLAANRLKITGNFPISKFEEVDELVLYCRENAIEILFQDSLQSMRDGQLDGNKLLKRVVSKFVQLSKDEDTTLFVVGHATKGGDFAGPARIKHDADAHIHLSLDPETGSRLFMLQKNRFGPALMPYHFNLTAEGIDFQQAETNAGDKGSKASERRDAAVEAITKLLLEGKKLSGYSHEEEPELIALGMSGGFMRAMLRISCNKLAAQGRTVGTCTINRREHNYVEPATDGGAEDDGEEDQE